VFTFTGITYPNGKVQRELLRSIYKKNVISPNDIAYMELHSTGTKVGWVYHSIISFTGVQELSPLVIDNKP